MIKDLYATLIRDDEEWTHPFCSEVTMPEWEKIFVVQNYPTFTRTWFD